MESCGRVSFCYVDDLITGFISLMDTPHEITGPINLGNPNEFTMARLAELVLEKTGSTSKIDFLPLPKDDPRQRQPDIRQAQTVLGWNPEVQLSQGLDATIDYFRSVVTSAAV
jgi:UDP-glucuronate decarboxylase